MQKILLILTIALLPMLSQAQTAADSIRAGELLDKMEQQTGKRIYSMMPDTTKLRISSNFSYTIDDLRRALGGTSFRANEYNGAIFILQDASLNTSLPALSMQNRNKALLEDMAYVPMVNALAENQVYEIGSPARPSTKKKVTLTGSITNFKTGTPIEGLQIFSKEAGVGTVTDKDGSFKLDLPQGQHTVQIKGIDIEDTYRNFMLYTDGIARIDLEEDDHTLEEIVVVSGIMANTTSTQVGVEKFKPTLLKNIPLALGEADVMKMIQTMPGIKTVGEASSGYNVRGGASDQNLILFNNATLYNPSHMFGIFSAFNSDMIDNAELYKSSIPAQYGGRISSVLNITPKIADYEKAHGAISIGLLTSKANVELPIVKDHLSLLVSGRTTYSDWMLKLVPEKSGYKDGSAGFYDLGGVLSYRINSRQRVNLNGYYSHDRFAFDQFTKYGYTNMNASIDWHGLHTSSLSSDISLGFDHYDYQNDETAVESEASRLSFNINQYFFKGLFNIKASEQHQIKTGWNAQLYEVSPGTYEPLGNSNIFFDQIQKEKALEAALFIEDEWTLNEKLSINAGLRWSLFGALGEREYNIYEKDVLPSENSIVSTEKAKSGEMFKTYQAPEVRLSARYMINEDMSLKVGFNTMHQYIHKVSNSTIMSPTDIWKLSDTNIKPQSGWQAAGGYYYQTPNRQYEMSAEVYYKRMNDYLTYRSSGSILMNHHLETDVISTEGHAYGIELQAKKPTGKLNGWVSYSYSRTFLRQNDKRTVNPVNDGDWFPTEYDRPHEFKFVGNYKFTQRYSLSCNADYSSGRPTTVPAGKYYDYGLQKFQPFYTERNSYRLPYYFRMDASFNIEPNHHLTQWTHSSFSIGCYNLLGRKNAYSVYYLVDGGEVHGYKLSIFGAPIPFVSYNIKF